MPFVQAGTAAIGRIRIRNGQGTPPAGPQPHPQTPQRVTRDAFKGGCPPKPRRLAPRPRPRKELRAKTLNAKGIEPETPFRTPDPPKTRDADQRHAKGRRQTHMGPSAAFLLCGRRESPRKRKGSPLGSPSPRCLCSASPPRARATRPGGRRRPSLPQGRPCRTIGAGRLNFRVRYGSGCAPAAIAAGPRGALRRGLLRGGVALQGALGAAQRLRKGSLENGRERRGLLNGPEGLGRLVAPG